MYRITEILPTSSGDRLLLRLLSSDGEAVTVNISCKTYGEMGLKKGELSDETASSLMNAAEHEKAVIKGLSILGYGMNSQRRLCQKLREKGFSSKVAEGAAEYLTQKGYVDESRDALRLCESMIKKGYGRKRILSSLRAKGYGDDAMHVADEMLSEVDFVPVCVRVIKSKFRVLPESREDVQKAIAKLSALGYNIGEIKSALQSVKSDL